MQSIFRQTIAESVAAMALLLAGGQAGYAQQIIIPEEWEKPMQEVMPLFTPDTLEICFMGDIMMHSEQIRSAQQSEDTYDFSSYFSLIEDKIRSADLAVANMEFTLGGKPYTGYPSFSAPDEIAGYAADCGFDIFLTANNHIFDKGSKGAERTLETYRRLGEIKGVMTTGLYDEKSLESGFPLTIIRKGMRIAFLNFTYGTNLGPISQWPKTNYMGERTRILKALKKAESDADICIVLPHWGTEYELKHSEQQEKMAEWLAENGADAIIGTHPHVIQDTCRIGKTPVAYSLGNAVSNMSATNTQAGLMATVRIARSENGDITMLPVELTWLWCSRPGGFGDSYIVIPIEKYLGRDDEWQGKWDHKKMKTTYERIRNNF